MANNWRELLAQAQANDLAQRTQAAAAQQTQQNTMAAAQKQTAAQKPQAANMGGITQSYYTSPTNRSNYESGAPVYQQSQAINDTAAALKQHQAARPGEYQGAHEDNIQSLISGVLNRPAFHYDFSQDPAYAAYARQYQQQGGEAMRGAQEETQALTAGYGNSYGGQVGQQTYQTWLQSMNDMLPTLKAQAQQQYADEGEQMMRNLNMLQTEDNRQYSQYRDAVEDWQNDLNYLYSMFSTMSKQEYQRYANDRSAWEADRAYWYQKAYDEQQQANWEKEFNAKYGEKEEKKSGGGGKKKRTYVDDHSIEASNTITDVLAKAQAERKKKFGK